MLDHLGCPEAAASVLAAIEAVIATGPRTRDMGGTAGTREVAVAIAAAVARPGV